MENDPVAEAVQKRHQCAKVVNGKQCENQISAYRVSLGFEYCDDHSFKWPV